MSSANILSLIGNTPLIEIMHIDRGPCRLFVKMESRNPSGSIKDRIALAMIEAAEHSGKLKPGGKLVEATAGNTGAALALVAAQKGYKLTLVILDKMASTTIEQCKALGAEVIMAKSSLTIEDSNYYQNVARSFAEKTGALYVNQFDNPANPGTHENITGPEIWRQMEYKTDAVVCGVGSGGTLAGLSTYFARVSPHTEMILADPEGSILAPLINDGTKVKAGSWQVVGIGEDFVPPNLAPKLKLVKKAYSIPDEESFETSRILLKHEGISAGLSSGTLVASALRYCREQTSPKRVVTFICDDGAKYLDRLFG